MKRFAILRNPDPKTTRADIDAGAMDALLSLAGVQATPGEAYDPIVAGISWVRSYWAPGTSWGLCLYTGRDETAIEEYHRLCEVPFVTIHEVDEVALADAAPYLPALSRTEPGILAIEAPTGGGTPGAETWTDLAPHWIRSYHDRALGTVVAAFRLDGLDLGAVEERAASEGWVLHRVVEIRPEEYLGGD